MNRQASIMVIIFILSLFSFLNAQSTQETSDDVNIYQYAGQLVPKSLLDRTSVNFDDVPVVLALNSMRSNHGINLSYNPSRIPRNRRVNLHLENVFVLSALIEVLKNTGMSLQITKGGNLVLVEGNAQSGEKQKRRSGGNITGSVVDKGTGDPLPGANVFLEGTSIGAATQLDGKYFIQNVPPGTYTVNIRYIGYKDQSFPIRIGIDEEVKLEIEMEFAAVSAGEVVVTAQAEGQMAAINQQISDRTIKNVVSAAKIQEIPDANAAESVARLPGISIVRSGGEGQKVAIRGMSPKYNVMMVNGVRMQSTDRDDRSVDLNMISSNILSGIEVTKAITPDMDADAVGGTVNLQIGKAQEGFHSKFAFQGGYGQLGEAYDNYKGTGFVSDRYFDDKLGVQLSGSIDRFDRSSDALGAGYDTNEEGEQGVLADLDMTSVTITDRVTSRRRIGGGLVLDYRLPNGSLLFNNFISNLSEDQVSMSNNFNVNTGQFSSNTSETELSNTVISNALQGDYKLFGIKVDFSLSNSVSKQYRPGDLVMNVIPEQNQSGFTSTYTIDEAHKATPSQFLNSVALRDILRVNTLTSTKRDVNETARNAFVNFDVPYNFGNTISGNFKFGGKYTYTNRDNDETRNYIKPDRGGNEHQLFTQMMIDSLWTDLGLEETDTGNGIRAFLFEEEGYDVGNFLSGSEGIDSFFYTGSVSKMNHYEALARQYGFFFRLPQESFERDFDYSSYQKAFYVMTEMHITKYLMFMPGVRYEDYETDYQAFGIDKWGPNWYDFDLEELTSTRKGENWFPQMHLRIKPLDWLDIRLASTRSVIYPDYRAFSPYYNYSTSGTRTLSYGNPGLKPALSQNYDLYVSVYDNYIGLATVGVFTKKIDDLIVSTSFSASDEEKIGNIVSLSGPTNVSTWTNLDAESEVKGFELDWQTHFWYLPSFLKGMVFNINYTHMSSETSYPYEIFVKQGDGIFAPFVAVDTSRTGRLPNQPNDILNMTMGFDYSGFSARLSFLFQANLWGGTARREELDTYTDDYYRWDLTIKQKTPWERVQFFMNVNNITDQPDRRYTIISDRLNSAGYYGRTADFGIRYEF